MSKKYTLQVTGEAPQEFARKDAALSHGEAAGKPFTVLSPSGKEVHSSDAGATVVAYSHGAKVFFRAMATGAVRFAADQGLTTKVSMADLTVTLEGGTAEHRAEVAARTEEMWAAAYSMFKDWKKENREARKGFRDSSEGRHNMLVKEWDVIAEFCTKAVQ